MARRRNRDNGGRYRRRGPVRDPYEAVLVVCEGKKTEPNYFNELRDLLRLSSANVQAVPSDYGNDPVSVVRYAEDRLNSQDGYDKVYCVFDRNGHANFDEARQRIRNSVDGQQGTLVEAASTPCFEFWILLHFVYTAAPQNAVGGRSSCRRVIDRLERDFLPEYQKNFSGVFDQLASRLDVAVTNADRLEAQNGASLSANPSTSVHNLVSYLRTLRKGNLD